MTLSHIVPPAQKKRRPFRVFACKCRIDLAFYSAGHAFCVVLLHVQEQSGNGD